jgi:hypothetical protein
MHCNVPCSAVKAESQEYRQKAQMLESEKATEVERYIQELSDADYREDVLKAENQQLHERLELLESDCDNKVRCMTSFPPMRCRSCRDVACRVTACRCCDANTPCFCLIVMMLHQ